MYWGIVWHGEMIISFCSLGRNLNVHGKPEKAGLSKDTMAFKSLLNIISFRNKLDFEPIISTSLTR
jgi:hypothetical protein